MKDECTLVLERIYLFLDGEILSEEERTEIRLHIEKCVPCYQRFGLERKMTFIVSRLGETAHCPEALRSRILGFLSNG